MRVLFLNQYFPPDPAPTGVLLAELAERLRADGHEVEFVGSGKAYRAGRGSGSRLRREAGALLQMLGAGWRARRAEVVISASSPPCLLIAATLIAWRHRARSVHWAMDLYPELAVALDEIPRGVLANCCLWMMQWCYRRTDVVVALDEDMAAHLRGYGLAPEICRPWVFAPVLAQFGEAASESASEPWTWLYSGNLGRAHEWETLLEAQALIEAADPSIHLAFQGSGPATQPAQERARALGLRRCTWRGYVDEAELPRTLLRAAVTVATQRPETRGLLWPSKLGLLLALPRPVLWIGPTDGEVATLLSTHSHHGIFAPGTAPALAEWILQQRGVPSPSTAPEKPAERRTGALNWWSSLVSLQAGRRPRATNRA